MPISPDEQHRVDVLLERIRSGEPCRAQFLRIALAMLEASLKPEPHGVTSYNPAEEEQ